MPQKGFDLQDENTTSHIKMQEQGDYLLILDSVKLDVYQPANEAVVYHGWNRRTYLYQLTKVHKTIKIIHKVEGGKDECTVCFQ